MLRDLPDLERLEDAGLLSCEIMVVDPLLGSADDVQVDADAAS
ncbi:hypothetical protein [Ensifer sp. 4252]